MRCLKKVYRHTLIGLTLMLFGLPAHAVPTLVLNPAQTSVLPGQTVTLDLILQQPFDGGLAGDTLLAFGFDLGFGPGLSFTAYSPASGWSDDSAAFADTDVAASHFPGIDDLGQTSLLLGQLSFDALSSVGISDITVSSDSLASFNQGLFYLNDPIPVDINASARISVIPSPAPAGLLLAGLGFMAGAARRRR